MKFKHKRTNGFSLVELLIAMTLGLILISSMIAVFTGNKRSSELNSATADLQESARYAIEQISRDVRMAGYLGCLTDAASLNIIGDTSPTTNFIRTAATGSAIQSASVWNPPIPGFTPPTTNTARPGTHALLLQFAGPDFTSLIEEMNVGGIASPAAPIHAADDNGFSIGDLAVISNCEFGELFQISDVAPNGSNTLVSHAAASNNDNGAFHRSYGDDNSIAATRLMKFNSSIYYIGTNGLSNESGQPLYSLYQQTLPYDTSDNPPVELVTGVENFKVTYGVRNDVTGGVRFVEADSPLFDPTLVNAIRVGILMVSYDEVAEVEDTNTYIIAGSPITPVTGAATDVDTHPVDRRIRFAFNTTIQIRNRRNL